MEAMISKLSYRQQQAEARDEEIKGMPEDSPTRHEAEENLLNFYTDTDTLQNEIRAIQQAKASERISEYVRTTRGLTLESLAIHLVPVRASVLSRAVDLGVLKRLTLLNVGAQAPVWSLLAKENKSQPLALTDIFTDNVTPQFVMCVSQLKEVRELFLLERSPKYKPESFAPKTTVSIDQIRRIVLRKHMATLKRLMIKCDNGPQWDVDEKTMLLICNRGANLEEMAISMGIRAVVRKISFLHHTANAC
jgi:hypothetical protein